MSRYWIYGVCVNLPEKDHPRLSNLRLRLWRNRGSAILVFTMCFWIGRGIGFILEGHTSRIVKFLSKRKTWGEKEAYFIFRGSSNNWICFNKQNSTEGACFGLLAFLKSSCGEKKTKKHASLWFVSLFFCILYCLSGWKKTYFLHYTSRDSVPLFSKQSYCVSVGIDLEWCWMFYEFAAFISTDWERKGFRNWCDKMCWKTENKTKETYNRQLRI